LFWTSTGLECHRAHFLVFTETGRKLPKSRYFLASIDFEVRLSSFSCFSPKLDENAKIETFWVLAATSSPRNQHSFSLKAGEVVLVTLEYTFRVPFQLFQAEEVWHSLRSMCVSSHWELFHDIALTDPLRGISLMERNAMEHHQGKYAPVNEPTEHYTPSKPRVMGTPPTPGLLTTVQQPAGIDDT